MSRRLASGLLRLGTEPGQVITITTTTTIIITMIIIIIHKVVAAVLPNVPEYPLLFMAASEAGLVLTTLNPAYTTGKKN